MENRVGSILKEFEYKWVSSVREMVRKMEKELSGTEESPLRDCQSAFWVTPTSGSREERSQSDGEGENTENVPPSSAVTPSSSKHLESVKTPAFEKKRKLTAVMNYLEAQHKASKRRKDSQSEGKFRVYTATPTVTSPQNYNTRRVLDFNFGEMEEHAVESSPIQELEIVETYQVTGTRKSKIYFTPSPQPALHDSSDDSVSFDGDELFKQLRGPCSLPGNVRLRIRNASLHRAARQAPFPVLNTISEAEDSE